MASAIKFPSLHGTLLSMGIAAARVYVLRLRERLHFKDLESFLNDHLSTSPDRILR